jgi:hypothetical protein
MDRYLNPLAHGFRTGLLGLALVLLTPAAGAQSPPPMPINPERDLNNLAQMKYCQKVLTHPDNQARVYDYDLERCAAALQQAERNMAWVPDDARPKMDERADQKARAIMANTRDVTQVLGACRQACQKMTPDYDEDAAAGGAEERKQADQEAGDDS